MKRILFAAAASIFATGAFAMQPAQPVGDYSANVEQQFEYNTEDMGEFTLGDIDMMSTASTSTQTHAEVQKAPGNEEDITNLKSGR